MYLYRRNTQAKKKFCSHLNTEIAKNSSKISTRWRHSSIVLFWISAAVKGKKLFAIPEASTYFRWALYKAWLYIIRVYTLWCNKMVPSCKKAPFSFRKSWKQCLRGTKHDYSHKRETDLSNITIEVPFFFSILVLPENDKLVELLHSQQKQLTPLYIFISESVELSLYSWIVGLGVDIQCCFFWECTIPVLIPYLFYFYHAPFTMFILM